MGFVVLAFLSDKIPTYSRTKSLYRERSEFPWVHVVERKLRVRLRHAGLKNMSALKNFSKIDDRIVTTHKYAVE